MNKSKTWHVEVWLVLSATCFASVLTGFITYSNRESRLENVYYLPRDINVEQLTAFGTQWGEFFEFIALLLVVLGPLCVMTICYSVYVFCLTRDASAH